MSASEEYKQLLKQNAKDADFLNDIGYCYYNLGNGTRRKNILRQALALNNGHARAWINLGMTLAQEQRTDESLEAFKKVVSPAQAQCNLAFILQTQKKLDEAKTAYRLALSLEPDLAFAPMRWPNWKRGACRRIRPRSPKLHGVSVSWCARAWTTKRQSRCRCPRMFEHRASDAASSSFAPRKDVLSRSERRRTPSQALRFPVKMSVNLLRRSSFRGVACAVSLAVAGAAARGDELAGDIDEQDVPHIEMWHGLHRVDPWKPKEVVSETHKPNAMPEKQAREILASADHGTTVGWPRTLTEGPPFARWPKPRLTHAGVPPVSRPAPWLELFTARLATVPQRPVTVAIVAEPKKDTKRSTERRPPRDLSETEEATVPVRSIPSFAKAPPASVAGRGAGNVRQHLFASYFIGGGIHRGAFGRHRLLLLAASPP